VRRPHWHSRRVASKLSRDQRELARVIRVSFKGVRPETTSESSPPVVVTGRVSYYRDDGRDVRGFLYCSFPGDRHLSSGNKGVRGLLYESRW
jgi:hypothetical protein